MSKLGDRMGTKLGPSARSILDAGRDGDNPTVGDRARVKRALMRTIAASTALGATSAASSAGAAGGGAAAAGIVAKGTSVSLGIKLFGVAVLALLAAGGVVIERASSPERAMSAAAPAPKASANVEVSTAEPAIVDRANTAPRSAIALDPAAPSRAGDAAPAEKTRAPSVPSAPRVFAREPVADRPAEEASAPVAVQPALAGEDPLASETRRLREAHGALQAGDPQKALALLGEQGGQLGEERAAARVLALCQSGKVEEAGSARSAFLRDHPRSPLADRVRGGCVPSSPSPSPSPNPDTK